MIHRLRRTAERGGRPDMGVLAWGELLGQRCGASVWTVCERLRCRQHDAYVMGWEPDVCPRDVGPSFHEDGPVDCYAVVG